MKRTTLLVWGTVAWLVGLGFAATFDLHVHLALIVAALFMAGMGIWRLRGRMKLVAILLLGFVLGLVRGHMYIADQRWYDVQDIVGQHATISGRVSDEPGWSKEGFFEFYMSELIVDGRNTPGTLKVKSQVGNVLEGQHVEVVGKVGRALGRAPAQIWYAKVTVLDHHQPYPIRFKQILSMGLASALSREQAGFVRGLLFGSRSGISSALEVDLRVDGLSHIIAVSGYNLTIIVGALTIMVRRKSMNTLLIVLTAIGLYVIMTGFAASILRAALMSVVLLVCRYTRRKVDLPAALAVTVFAMTTWSPRYLLQDIGWQLSVLALVGVLVVAPRIAALRDRQISSWKQIVLDILIVSLAAHLATAPLIAYYFGTFSLIAPIANLTILPAVPALMFAGLLAATLGVVNAEIAFTLMWPLRQAIMVIEHIISWFARWPLAELVPGDVSIVGVCLSYAVLALFAVLYSAKSRNIRSKMV